MKMQSTVRVAIGALVIAGALVGAGVTDTIRRRSEPTG
jgi:hypothetical protein